MAKLSVLAISFALLFLVATATVTITTVEIDEANPSRSCQQQIKGRPLTSCEEFLKECSRSPRMMMLESESRCSQQKQDCCDEMKEMDEQCRCQGIKKMMQRQQGQMGQQQMEKMTEKAMDLPRMCRMGPGSCEMRSFWY
ncbi:hypothetical protein ACFE04_020011 [Oxalis oulophora]